MNIPTLQPRLHPEQLTMEQLEKNPDLSQSEKINEASRQFEAVLLRQILTQIRQPVFRSSVTGNSTSTSIYEDMINYQMADTISKSSGLGLANSLRSQLNNQLLHPKDAASKKTDSYSLPTKAAATAPSTPHLQSKAAAATDPYPHLVRPKAPGPAELTQLRSSAPSAAPTSPARPAPIVPPPGPVAKPHHSRPAPGPYRHRSPE